MIEDGSSTVDLSLEAPVADAARGLARPVAAATWSTLRDGRKMTAVQLQMEYLELARKYVEDRFGSDVDDDDHATCSTAGSRCSTRLADDPMQLSRELDWVAKLELLEGYRDRDGLGLGPPAAAARRPAVLRRPARPRPVQPAGRRAAGWSGCSTRTRSSGPSRSPPEDTRAYFRGRCLRQYADSVAAASWDSVIFDIPGRESLQRVPTLEPLRGTKAHVGDLLDAAGPRRPGRGAHRAAGMSPIRGRTANRGLNTTSAGEDSVGAGERPRLTEVPGWRQRIPAASGRPHGAARRTRRPRPGRPKRSRNGTRS